MLFNEASHQLDIRTLSLFLTSAFHMLWHYEVLLSWSEPSMSHLSNYFSSYLCTKTGPACPVLILSLETWLYSPCSRLESIYGIFKVMQRAPVIFIHYSYTAGICFYSISLKNNWCALFWLAGLWETEKSQKGRRRIDHSLSCSNFLSQLSVLPPWPWDTVDR